MSEDKWVFIGDISKEDLKNIEISFNANDLREWFGDFDKWWLQIKGDDVCVSYEGVDYEPHFYGKIKKVMKLQEGGIVSKEALKELEYDYGIPLYKVDTDVKYPTTEQIKKYLNLLSIMKVKDFKISGMKQTNDKKNIPD